MSPKGRNSVRPPDDGDRATPVPPVAPDAPRARRAAVVAEGLWLAAQVGVVAAYAVGVRPSSGYPLPVADSADLGLAVVQMTLAALLGRDLLAPAGRLLRAVAVAATCLTLAARLAGRPPASIASMTLVVAAWLAALVMLTQTAAGRLLAVGLTIGLPVLWYLRIEYAGRPPSLGGWPAVISPTLGVCATGLHGSVWPALATPLGVLMLGLTPLFGPKFGLRLRSL